MAELGFWSIAQEDPEKLALVDPDEREVRRGRAARVVQPGRARPARRRASSRATPSAMVLPEQRRVVRARTSPCCRPASTSCRSTTISSGPRSPTSSRTPRRRCSSRTSGSPTSARPPPTRSGSRRSQRFAVGDIPGFRPYDDLKAGQPTTMPEDRTTGAVMNYTSGTTGKPQGRPPTARRRGARGGRHRLLGDARSSSAPAARRQRAHLSARRSTTRRCSCSRAARCTSATRSC